MEKVQPVLNKYGMDCSLLHKVFVWMDLGAYLCTPIRKGNIETRRVRVGNRFR